jgi:hypothetical protein
MGELLQLLLDKVPNETEDGSRANVRANEDVSCAF